MPICDTGNTLGDFPAAAFTIIALLGQRGRSPVCPQNRAYGSVHGSSRKTYPPIDVKPMR